MPRYDIIMWLWKQDIQAMRDGSYTPPLPHHTKIQRWEE